MTASVQLPRGTVLSACPSVLVSYLAPSPSPLCGLGWEYGVGSPAISVPSLGLTCKVSPASWFKSLLIDAILPLE